MRISLTAAFFFLFAILFVGCRKKSDNNSDCFKLKAVYLYQGSNTACASNIWEVQESPDKEIPPGTCVDFVTDQDDYPVSIRLGDIVSIKLKMKIQVVPGIDPFCPYNYIYILQGDFCK